MLDFFNLPSGTLGDVQTFRMATSSATDFQVWNAPRGISTVCIIAIGPGGNGGNGHVGAASTAGGGGGGGSGAVSIVTIPASFLPSTLFVRAGLGGSGLASRVCIAPAIVDNNHVVYAFAGQAGGNSGSGVAGSAGTAAAATVIAGCPLAGLGVFNFLAGQVGIAGGAAVAGLPLTLPITGLFVTGGTGGGGLGNAASTGFAGGSFTVAGAFPAHTGGIPSGSQTVAPGNGSNGFNGVFRGLQYNYGGTGGASSGGAATGAGLRGGAGGAGGIGCGGGGGGGALTGSVQGLGGKGGDGMVVIIAF